MVTRETRHTTILLIGVLTVEGLDGLCRVRNISTGGMRIETRMPVKPGQHIRLELKNGSIAHGVVVWADGGDAGIRFDHPVDTSVMLASPPKMRHPVTGLLPRQPRMSCSCPVVLRRAGYVLKGTMTDISQSGARIETSGMTQIDDRIVLLAGGLASVGATIRWMANDAIGVAFDAPLYFEELSQWLTGPDRFSAAVRG
jgi:hypothetical protein